MLDGAEVGGVEEDREEMPNDAESALKAVAEIELGATPAAIHFR